MGCDGSILMIVLIFRTFQSTHPRGVRHRRVAEQTYTNYFNPRTHVGCDPLIFTIVLYISNFNPRTHVGCDGSKYGSPQGVGISIHAPTWGATRGKISSRCNPKFQSTHPRGVRRYRPTALSVMVSFQSTHPRGVRLRQSWIY